MAAAAATLLPMLSPCGSFVSGFVAPRVQPWVSSTPLDLSGSQKVTACPAQQKVRAWSGRESVGGALGSNCLIRGFRSVLQGPCGVRRSRALHVSQLPMESVEEDRRGGLVKDSPDMGLAGIPGFDSQTGMIILLCFICMVICRSVWWLVAQEGGAGGAHEGRGAPVVLNASACSCREHQCSHPGCLLPAVWTAWPCLWRCCP